MKRIKQYVNGNIKFVILLTLLTKHRGFIQTVRRDRYNVNRSDSNICKTCASTS